MDIPALSSLHAADSARVGGKAAGLGELIAMGLPVPPGFVLPSELLATDLAADESSFSLRLSALVQEHGLRPPFAVRSSAAVEDGAQASFAGQFATELDVPTAGLAGAVARCARSGRGASAAYYADRMGDTSGVENGVPISVIVQEQVAAELSGVLFTADPVTGDRDSYLLDVVPGAGAALVGGETEPFSIRLSGSGFDVVNRPDWSDVALEARLLGLVGGIRSMGEAITERRSTPQDIELCITSEDTVVPVQARPITSLPTPRLRTFDLEYVPVSLATRPELDALTTLDKVRLRLIAEEASLEVGPAWIIRAKSVADAAATASAPVPTGLRDAGQISFVLQEPPRLSGSIVRRFSAAGNRQADLDGILQLVGAAYDEFALIATQVRTALMSGVARRFGDRILIEVGFGAFVPKGVVTTSQYVCTTDGGVLERELILQEHAFLIEEGRPRRVVIDRTPELSDEQCRQVCLAVSVANNYYEQPSVEFGIEEDGTLFLIDFVDEATDDSAAPQELGIISPGALVGRVVRIDEDQELLVESLDSHFHSDRSEQSGPLASDDPVIVLARLPYLSLERFIRERDPRSIGFIFRNCSYLSHLSIVLRELGIPAMVDREAFDTLTADTRARLDSNTRTVTSAESVEAP
ncbi:MULTISPECIES: PEP/pyruvate-binding domain-containing protein [unclassified Streptomyces]|uniref:PEP/pyruvate-binding domain-containing protein n=1 Tax=unclassified Streptomyces TaxID=2593676 RepID=UPI00403D21DE